MMSDQLGELRPERWKTAGYSWGYGAAIVLPAENVNSALPTQYGWNGGGYARVWVEPKSKILAYFAFPMEPPGDFEMLREFERLVNAAKK
jgi:CubicO group peptidase (beta-lactamase class C family)